MCLCFNLFNACCVILPPELDRLTLIIFNCCCLLLMIKYYYYCCNYTLTQNRICASAALIRVQSAKKKKDNTPGWHYISSNLGQTLKAYGKVQWSTIMPSCGWKIGINIFVRCPCFRAFVCSGWRYSLSYLWSSRLRVRQFQVLHGQHTMRMRYLGIQIQQSIASFMHL